MIVNDQDPAQSLAAIVNGASVSARSDFSDVGSRQSSQEILDLNKKDRSENSEKSERLQKVLEENKAIRNGLELAKKITGDSLSALNGISEQLRQARDLSKEAGGSSSEPAVVKNYAKEFSKISTTIDDLSKQVQVPDFDGYESNGDSNSKTGFTNGRVSSADLGLVNRDLESSDGAREAEAAAKNALAEIQLKQAAASGLVNHLESQLANLDEAIVKGARALSAITDGNLLIKTSEHSQLDSALHTSVLVQQEALQQNRWVGRVLDQLQ